MDSKNNPPKNLKTNQKLSKTPTPSTNKRNAMVIGAVIVAVLLIGGVTMTTNRNRLADTASKIVEENVINSLSDNKVKINSRDNSYTISDSSGNSSTSNNSQTISADFPSDIPLYTNQKVIGNTRTKSTKGIGWMVSANSNDSAESVSNFFKDKLTTTGWTNVSEFSVNNTFSAEYTKGSVSFSYVIAPGTSNTPSTGITYAVSQKQ